MSPWLALISAVLAMDTWLVGTGRPTLSNHYQNATDTHPVLTGGLTLYVLAHLHGRLPLRGDLLYGLGALTARAFSRTTAV